MSIGAGISGSILVMAIAAGVGLAFLRRKGKI